MSSFPLAKPSAHLDRRTKIIATVGPASWDLGVLEQLIAAGADVFRLNFSHAGPDKHAQTIETIRKAAPEAEEAIKYRMPTFVLHGGNLVHFAAFDRHVGFYPAPSGISAFAKELAGYQSAKGSVRFPLDRPVPYPLVARITRFRVAENAKRLGASAKA